MHILFVKTIESLFILFDIVNLNELKNILNDINNINDTEEKNNYIKILLKSNIRIKYSYFCNISKCIICHNESLSELYEYHSDFI